MRRNVGGNGRTGKKSASIGGGGERGGKTDQGGKDLSEWEGQNNGAYKVI